MQTPLARKSDNFSIEILVKIVPRTVFGKPKAKVLHPKYYEHLKKGAHQRHWMVSGRLACRPLV